MHLRKDIDLLREEHGSALALVLVIITAITTIIAVVLMGHLLQRRFIVKEVHDLRAFYLAEAGVYKTLWLLSGNEGKTFLWRPQHESVAVGDEAFVFITVSEWGGFLRIVSRASYKSSSKTLQALVGEVPVQPFSQAVFIGGSNYPLVVTGNNRIIGDVTVGSEGVKSGRIKGRGFQGTSVVEGRVTRVSVPTMPDFDPTFFQNAFQRYETALAQPSGLEYFDNMIFDRAEALRQLRSRQIFIHGDVLVNIFSDEDIVSGPLRIVCSGAVTVQGKTYLQNRIEIIAGGKMTIADEVQITDAILYSSAGMEISSRAKIEGQLLSPVDIVIKDEAELTYPSLVYCSGQVSGGRLHGVVSLADRSILRGMAILAPSRQLTNTINDTRLLVDKNAKVVGAIYSSNDTELKGTVIGSVVTNKFYLYEPPTTYLNWLQDAYIDRTQLPGRFRTPLVFDAPPKLDIVKWEHSE